MIAQRPPAPLLDFAFSMSPLQREALRLLRQAWDAASKQAHDVWQFAVEIERLYAAGLGNTELRQMLCLGYLEHARERTTPRAEQRAFQPLHTLVLPQRTCFVLAAKGREIVARLDAETKGMVVVPATKPSQADCYFRDVPYWDSDFRELWWQDRLIKEFHRPAINQVTILKAFEEEGWPARIDDPLPQSRGIDPKVRLHDTIKSLNRHHFHSILSFRGDGSGKGVLWRKVKAN